MQGNQVIIIGVAVLVVLTLGLILMIVRFYRKVPPDCALIISTPQGVKVTMKGSPVLPVIHHAERIDLTVQSLAIERTGKDGASCKDGIRADIRLEFLVRVNPTEHDILAVARSIGAARATDPDTMAELFTAKFSDAVSTVVGRVEFDDLVAKREEVRDDILRVIGADLGGYCLDDVAIASMEMTPIEHLDRNNLLDAAGIRKITERTTRELQAKNQQIIEQRKAELDVEREKAEVEARHQLDVLTVKVQALVDALVMIAEQEGRLSEDARLALKALISDVTVDERSTPELAAAAQSELDRMRSDSESALASLRTDEADRLTNLQADSLSVLDSAVSDLSD